MALSVLVVNRAQDIDRWEGFVEAANKVGVAVKRIPAMDAHRADFPFALQRDLIGDHFWGEAQVKLGALGCFLSHRRAWQHLVDSGESHALICEDDARLSERTDRIEKFLDAHPDADLVFANDRMAAWSNVSGAQDERWRSLGDVLDGLEQAATAGVGADLPKAPGADCYVVSRRAAETMLALTAEQKIICGVDWALVSAGLGRKEITDQPPEENGSSTCADNTPAMHDFASAMVFCERHLVQSRPGINAVVLSEPVAHLDRELRSVLRHTVTRPIKELTGIGSNLAHTEYVSTLKLGPGELVFAGRSGNDPVMALHREGRLWEQDAISALLAEFPQDGVFVDVGAHLGNHTVAVTRMGAASSAIAIEPNAEITRLLAANLAMNGLTERVEIVGPGTALGRASATAWFVRNRRKSSESMVKSDVPEDQRERAEQVSLLTGDDLLRGKPVHAIKINTSGSEVEVLKGLSETLSGQRPILLVAHANDQADRIERVVSEYGYQVRQTFESDRKNRSSSLIVPVPPPGFGQ